MSKYPEIDAVLAGESDGCIVCGDCLEVMADMPDGCVDAVVSDPPYGVGIEYASFEDTPENALSIGVSAVNCARRVGRVVAVTPGNLLAWSYPIPDWALCWFIPAGAGMCSWGFNCWQPILVYGKDPYILAKRSKGRRDAISLVESAKKNSHPCPKPINFMKWLLGRVSAGDADIILDPFVGSGTTCEVAKRLGRRYIGIDISEKYCQIARNRIRDTEKPLFT